MTTMLVEHALRVSVVLGIGAVAVSCGRRRSAAVRHAIVVASVAGALALPVLASVWPASLRSAWQASPTYREVPTAPSIAPAVVGSAVTVSVDVEARAKTAPSPALGAWRRVAGILPWLWMAGVLLAVTRLARGVWALQRCAANSRVLDDDGWRDACATIQRRLGVDRPVQLLVGAGLTDVITWGWRRPSIVLPAAAREWSSERRHVVLAHELSHVARADWLTQLSSEVLRAVHWYQPLAWWACRRGRHESERAADSAVIELGIDPVAYAEHLVDLARRPRHARESWLPAPAMARSSSFEGRVRATLDTNVARGPVTRTGQLVVAAITALVVSAAASVGTAQTPFHSFRGAVVDVTDRVVPGVVLVVTNPATSATYEVRSDANGRFEFVGLAPATYAVSVKALGFRPQSESVAIASDVERTVRLVVARLQETISVVDNGQPMSTVDPNVLAQRELRVRSAMERQDRVLNQCAASPRAAVGGAIVPPIKLVHTNPEYPAHLRPSGVAGKVTMTATIDRDGNVRDVADVAGPHPALQTTAIEAVRQWKFTTTLLNCEPIEVEMLVTVNFSVQP